MDIQLVLDAATKVLELILLAALPVLVTALTLWAYETWKAKRLETKGTKDEHLMDMLEYAASVVVAAMSNEEVQKLTTEVEEKLVEQAQEVLTSHGITEIHVAEIIAAVRLKVAETFESK